MRQGMRCVATTLSRAAQELCNTSETLTPLTCSTPNFLTPLTCSTPNFLRSLSSSPLARSTPNFLRSLSSSRASSSQSSSSGFSSQSSSSGLSKVVIVDPREALEKGKSILNSTSAVSLELPSRFMDEHLRHMRHALGEYDEPINSWVAGEEGEIFEYELVGSIATPSGYVAAILEQDVSALDDALKNNKMEDVSEEGEKKSLAQTVFRWLMLKTGLAHMTPKEVFKQLVEHYNSLNDGEVLSEPPFVAFGHVLEASGVQVYVKRGPAAEVTGLMISSGDVDD